MPDYSHHDTIKPTTMSRSTDPEHFFQTSHSIAETKRKDLKSKNNNGSPIRMQSKILAIMADPASSAAVYIAESAGTARRVVLETGETSHLYRGPTTPLTSIALSPTSRNAALFAGSWDKSIWSWNSLTRAPQRRYYGHTDFVKALLYLHLNGNDILISGSADASIIIWDIPSGSRLHVLRGGHTRGILDLAIDPTTYPPSPSPPDSQPASMILFSASSDREIRRWHLSTALSAPVHEIDPAHPILQHETSVCSLHFDRDADLWTASADGTAKCLSREGAFAADTTLPHGDFVRGVAVDDAGGWVVTVGRNEEVKVWDRAGGTLHHTYSGHFEEVTGVVLVGRAAVTVGIDATIRRWSLLGEDLGRARQEAKNVRDGVVKEDEGGEGGEGKEGLMTEEEERELAELMGEE